MTFANATTGWITVVTQNNVGKLYVVPDFTSVETGWILEYTSNKYTQATALFKTIDGGHTWTQVHAYFPRFIMPKSAF